MNFGIAPSGVEHASDKKTAPHEVVRKQEGVAKQALQALFEDSSASLRQLVQQFLITEEALALTKLQVQKVAREWASQQVVEGASDERIHELFAVLTQIQEQGGSLGAWAYEEITPASREDEAFPERPTKHDLECYLERVLMNRAESAPHASPDTKQGIRAQAHFESLVERAQNSQELLSRILAHPELHALSPEDVALQFTLFLLSHDGSKSYLFDVWKQLVMQARRRISLQEVRTDQLLWRERLSEPDYTYRMKYEQVRFLLNAPQVGYLRSDAFLKDVADFLEKQTTRLNRRELPTVLDHIEEELNARRAEVAPTSPEAQKVTQQLVALEQIRAEALRDFGRPSLPNIPVGR